MGCKEVDRETSFEQYDEESLQIFSQHSELFLVRFTVTKGRKLLYWWLTNLHIKTFCGFQIFYCTPNCQRLKRFATAEKKNCKHKGFFMFHGKSCSLQSAFYVYLFLGLHVTRCNNRLTGFAKEAEKGSWQFWVCTWFSCTRSTVSLEIVKLRLRNKCRISTAHPSEAIPQGFESEVVESRDFNLNLFYTFQFSSNQNLNFIVPKEPIMRAQRRQRFV